MKLVIEIDEKEYNGIKEDNSGMFGGHIFQAIRNGRPLPEYCPVIHHKKPITKEDIDKSTWIPVTEKLPEYQGAYLVTVKDAVHERLDAMACKYVPTNVVFRWTPFLPNIEDPVVIAWMPLPEAYKESEEC